MTFCLLMCSGKIPQSFKLTLTLQANKQQIIMLAISGITRYLCPSQDLLTVIVNKK